MLKSKSILITGGTGSFGKKFTEHILTKYSNISRLVIYSRDELKQFEMQQMFPDTKYPQIRYFIGDVRDKSRLYRAFEGIDTVIHAAAMKQVPASEYNPFEAIKTNILGAQNIIEAATDCDVKNVVALSTDKAAAPINLYGATKLASDKLFVAANHSMGNHGMRFSVVRYGNVMGSRGSVIPYFLKKRKEGVLSITDKRMTRFNISLEEGVDMVLYALENMWGGEIFVPKIPSYKVVDVAEAICPGCKIDIVGIRPGEKIHEEMITETDSLNTLEFQDYFVILPSFKPSWNIDDFKKKFNGEFCTPGYKYNSGENDKWLSVDEIRELIKIHVDPTFSI